LVDVVASINDKNIKAIIIGDGPERDKIQRKIIEKGLTNQIKMLGQLSHNECLFWMNRSKILLHPSSFEGASTVVLEALYYGCNIVSFTSPMTTMSVSFHQVETKEEMIGKVKFIMESNLLNKQEIVNTSAEAAKKLMSFFKRA
jgi:glycosyltransferase involved in cell wall biosynthesis